MITRGKQGFGYAVCTRCGFADSETARVAGHEHGLHLPDGFDVHPPLDAKRNVRCWQAKDLYVLRNQELSASETTDIVLIDFGARLVVSEDSEALAWTLSHAFRIAGSRVLGIETRELGGMPLLLREGRGIAIYDDVPGGAGHVQKLLDDHNDWMTETLRTLYGDKGHDARCETACLDCLLTYDAQYAMERRQLQRKKTYKFLLAQRDGSWSPPERKAPAERADAVPSKEERLRAAQLLRDKRRGGG